MATVAAAMSPVEEIGRSLRCGDLIATMPATKTVRGLQEAIDRGLAILRDRLCPSIKREAKKDLNKGSVGREAVDDEDRPFFEEEDLEPKLDENSIEFDEMLPKIGAEKKTLSDAEPAAKSGSSEVTQTLSSSIAPAIPVQPLAHISEKTVVAVMDQSAPVAPALPLAQCTVVAPAASIAPIPGSASANRQTLNTQNSVVASPKTAAPCAAPQVAAPSVAPQIAAPSVAPQIAAPSAAPQIAAPSPAPQIAAPSPAPQIAAPCAAPQIAAPCAAPQIAATSAPPQTAAPSATPQTVLEDFFEKHAAPFPSPPPPGLDLYDEDSSYSETSGQVDEEEEEYVDPELETAAQLLSPTGVEAKKQSDEKRPEKAGISPQEHDKVQDEPIKKRGKTKKAKGRTAARAFLDIESKEDKKADRLDAGSKHKRKRRAKKKKSGDEDAASYDEVDELEKYDHETSAEEDEDENDDETDPEMKDFEDNRPLDDLYESVEGDYKATRKPRSRLIRGDSADEEEKAAPSAAEVEKIREQLKLDTSLFLGAVGPEARAAKQKILEQDALDALCSERTAKVEKRTKDKKASEEEARPVSPSPPDQLKKTKQAAPAQKEATKKKSKSTTSDTFIAKEITRGVFDGLCVWLTISKAFTDCYGGEALANKPFRQYVQQKGKSSQQYRRIVEDVRKKEQTEHDLETIIEALRGGAGSSKKRGRSAVSPTILNLEQLVRAAGGASALSYYENKEPTSASAYVRPATQGFLVRPNRAYIIKIETSKTTDSRDCTSKKNGFIVTEDVLKIMVCTHSLIKTDCFITRTEKITQWIAENRERIRAGDFTAEEVKKALSAVYDDLWKEWSRIRTEFCALLSLSMKKRFR
jgi:hypothetical protein